MDWVPETIGHVDKFIVPLVAKCEVTFHTTLI